MRKILLSLLSSLFLLFTTEAQISESEANVAKQLVTKNSVALGLSADDLNNYIISATYQTADGIRMIYLQQSLFGIPVYNQMQVLAFKNEKLASNTGSRIPAIHKIANSRNGTPSLDVRTAVLTAFAESKITTQQEIVIKNVIERKIDFGKFDATYENVIAELLWVPVNDGKEVKLAWQVQVAPAKTDDMWLIRVDAATNTVIGKDNLTVYDSWHKEGEAVHHSNNVVAKQKQEAPKFDINNPFTPIINGASYLVIKYPAESPQHAGGTAALHTDPWTWAPGNATSLKWHSDGTNDYLVSRGNNVWATEDRAAANQNTGLPATSSTPDPLTFNFPPDYTVAPTTPAFQQFAITNLFYWNNLLHDVTYQYGFDEASGNFQVNNQGRGGAGNDDVMALAQSGAGTNNANFLTPVDGQRGRMRMYLFTAPNPDRDGDLDNGIICHEFGHGISNRLTGGPANSSCLQNAEQGGEGWGDYNALMLTTNWATAAITDGVNPRPMGTYALNQPVTGGGIRNYPYSTNIAVNPLTYANMGVPPIGTQVHNIGEIWCMALWEMTWEIINQTGTINPDLLNPTGAGGIGGNSIAFKLVTEGMRLQPCSPGYIDARDAILKADTIFFGAQYSCSIWKAFAKRGMGRGASQGSSNSATDQIPSFVYTSGVTKLTESVPAESEGLNVTYYNTVTADNCGAITNFFVTDTLPTNVTYVSGGTYNAGNRTVTFSPVTLSAGQSQTFSYVATINTGTYFAPVTHFNEPVAGATIPAAWSASSSNAVVWSVATTVANSAPNSFFAPNSTTLQTDLQLATTSQYTINPNTVSNYTTLSFWHKYNTEAGWDGGVVEISTNNGASWSDVGAARFLKNGYNGSLGTGSNLAGRAAFTGTSEAPGFIESVVNLSSFAGQNIRIRFRFASDNNTGPPSGTAGWWVDDIVLSSEPAVQMRSNLFNASASRQSFSDTITRILPASPVCVPVAITTQPVNINGCAGANGSFSVVATGTTPVYQWQVNSGSGFVNVTNVPPYTGATTATLSITNMTGAMNGYQYRCVLSNTCTPAFNSNTATLNVGAVAAITSQPVNSTVCTGVNTSFSVTATGASTYQWQVNTGSGFVNVTNVAPYSGATSATLTITGAAASMTGYQYQCVLGSCGSPVTSNAATLTISVPVTITTQPASTAICEGSDVGFTIAVTGTASGYQWQISTDGGTTYTNIAGATTTSYNIPAAPRGQNNYRYRCVVTGACGPVTSNAAILTVNPLPVFSLANQVPAVICVSDPPITLNGPVSGGIWSGTGVQGGSFDPSAAGTGAATVTYTVTAAGCVTARSTQILVNECAERHLTLSSYPAVIVYPNPNKGVFNIRINTDLYTQIGVKIFNSQGQVIKTQSFNGVTYGTVLPMDIANVPGGTYHLYIYSNENGAFSSKGVSIMIYR